MNPLNKTKIKVSVDKYEKKSLQGITLTTSGFFGIQPVFYEHMTAVDHIKGVHAFWSRLNPLVAPVMTQSEYHLSRFYVRYKDVFKGWDDYDNGSVHQFSNGTSGFIYHEPSVSMRFLNNMFVPTNTYEDGVTLTVPGDPDHYDIINYVNSSDKNGERALTEQYVLLVERGIQFLKLLRSLGYEPTWTYADTREVSILALLCYARIYLDHYYPKGYIYQSVTYRAIEAALQCDLQPYLATLDTASPSYNSLYVGFMNNLPDLKGTCMQDDVMYSVWDRPNTPNSGSFKTDFSYLDMSIGSDNSYRSLISQSLSPNGDPNIISSTAGGTTSVYPSRLSQNVLNMLRSVSNMVKRYQLAGSFAAQRFFAKYGIYLQDDHSSIKLKEDIIPMKIGDVESNAFTSVNGVTAVVGDLAGKGVAAGKFSFNHRSGSHAGMYIAILTAVCNSQLVQGMDRHNLHNTQLDNFTPEFDQATTNMVTRAEVYNSLRGKNNDSPDGGYGHLPYYYEYASKRAVLNGDFRILSRGAEELTKYHTFRLLSNDTKQSDVYHSLNFIHADNTDIQGFNRIFYNEKVIDQFQVLVITDYDKYGPKKSLMEPYKFDGDEAKEEVVVPGNNSDLN